MASRSMAAERGTREADASQSLLDFIINSERNLTEREVRPLAQQLVCTLSLMHAHGVVHRNLKTENIHVRVYPAGTRASTSYIYIPPSLSGWRLRRRRRRPQQPPWQAILTDFTYAAVTTPFPARTTGSPAPPLIARASDQFSPAPELLRVDAPPRAMGPEPGVHVQHARVPYAGPPVDVWGLGVVLFILICGRVPFDGLTLDALREATLRSPESLSFPKRVSRDCRDLLRRMLHVDPVARASLEEVLDHSWMQLDGPVGADAAPKHAALRWPDQVDRQVFYRIAALECKNGDDAWKSLDDALGLLSHFCGACSGPRGDSPTLNGTSNLGRFFRGAREFPGKVWSLFAAHAFAIPPPMSANRVWVPSYRGFGKELPFGAQPILGTRMEIRQG